MSQNSSNQIKKPTKTLSKVQKNVLIEIKNNEDRFQVLDKFKVSDDKIKFWRKTNKKFNDEYLKVIGITEVQERFIEVYPKKLCNVAATCRTVGISRQTFYRWRDECDTFRTFVNNTFEELCDNIETMLFKKIFEEKNEKALMFFAKTKMKHRGYSEKFETTTVNINSSPFENMTIDEINKEIEIMEQMKIV